MMKQNSNISKYILFLIGVFGIVSCGQNNKSSLDSSENDKTKNQVNSMEASQNLVDSSVKIDSKVNAKVNEMTFKEL